jgi:hypothetical protein
MFTEEFKEKLEALYLDATSAVSALVARRVQMEGTNAKGGKFSSYSTTPYPAFKYYSTALRKNARGQLEAKMKTDKYISYSEFRQLVGNQVNHKDFTLTGEMWADFGITEVKMTDNIITAELGFLIEANTEKMVNCSMQEGVLIIEPSDDELEFIIDSVIEDLWN